MLLTLGLALFAQPLAALLDAPPEAMDHTVAYIRICGLGMVFIVAYNFLGAVLRGAGDAKTPLYTVAVAWAMSRLPETSLFLIGLGTPASSLVQDLLCVGYFLLLMRKGWREAG